MDLGKDTEQVVGVIAFDKSGKVLLIQGQGGKWSFPKGRKKEKETEHEAAVREALEEAGIDLRGMDYRIKIQLRYGSYYIYQLAVTADKIQLVSSTTPDEILKVAWVFPRAPSFRKEEKNADLRAWISHR
jgi:8-oxo-dGTP pyrophosphatase MutT (NUDIX family)